MSEHSVIGLQYKTLAEILYNKIVKEHNKIEELRKSEKRKVKVGDAEYISENMVFHKSPYIDKWIDQANLYYDLAALHFKIDKKIVFAHECENAKRELQNYSQKPITVPIPTAPIYKKGDEKIVEYVGEKHSKNKQSDNKIQKGETPAAHKIVEPNVLVMERKKK